MPAVSLWGKGTVVFLFSSFVSHWMMLLLCRNWLTSPSYSPSRFLQGTHFSNHQHILFDLINRVQLGGCFFFFPNWLNQNQTWGWWVHTLLWPENKINGNLKEFQSMSNVRIALGKHWACKRLFKFRKTGYWQFLESISPSWWVICHAMRDGVLQQFVVDSINFKKCCHHLI